MSYRFWLFLGMMAVGFAGQAYAQQWIVVVRNVPAVEFGDFDVADYDGDGDGDLVVVGQRLSGTPMSRIFRYEERLVEPIQNSSPRIVALHTPVDLPIRTNLLRGTVRWGDYDGDGDPDLLMSGLATDFVTIDSAVTLPVTELFNNLDGITFVPTGISLPLLFDSRVAWGDYDGDGDLDLMLAGHTETGHFAGVYRNEGEGGFVNADAGLTPLSPSSVDWGDYDGDGDLDLVMTGTTVENTPVTRVYRNDGNDTFSPVDTGLPGLYLSTGRWGDYDGDGDLDLLLTGGRLAPRLMQGEAHLYRNDGGTFVDTGVELVGTFGGNAAWGDYDGDGDLDFFIMGIRDLDAPDHQRLLVFENRGTAGFVSTLGLQGVAFGNARWYDYNGDGRLDILMAGRQNDSVIITMFEL